MASESSTRRHYSCQSTSQCLRVDSEHKESPLASTNRSTAVELTVTVHRYSCYKSTYCNIYLPNV
jgi:hypothetical protein